MCLFAAVSKRTKEKEKIIKICSQKRTFVNKCYIFASTLKAVCTEHVLLIIFLNAIIAKSLFLYHFIPNKKVQNERTFDRTHFCKL